MRDEDSSKDQLLSEMRGLRTELEELARAKTRCEAEIERRTKELQALGKERDAEVNERKKVEEEARRQATELDAAIDAVTEGLAFVDMDIRLARINPEGLRILGIEQDAPSFFETGRLIQFTTLDGHALTFDEMPAVRTVRGEIVRPQIFCYSKPPAGERVYVRVSGGPLKMPDGRQIGAVVAFSDVSSLIELEGQREALLAGLQQAKEHAERRAAELDQVLEALPVGVFLADRQGRLYKINKAGENIWGGHIELGIADYRDYKAWRPGSDARLDSHEWGMARTLREGVSTDEELEIETFDGQKKTIRATSTPVLDKQGDLLAGVAVNVDITALKQGEKALRESTERYRLVNLSTHDVIWDWHLETGRITWDGSAIETFGASLRDLGDRMEDWYDRIHPEDRDRVVESIAFAIDGGADSWIGEYRYRCAGGEWKTFLDRGHIARDGRGGACRMIGSMQDISNRKRLEEELRKREEEYRTLIENLPNTIISKFGQDGRYLYISPSVELVTGYPVIGFIGKRPRETPWEEDFAKRLEIALSRVMRTAEPDYFQYAYTTPKGVLHRALRVTPERVTKEGVETIIAFSYDVSELKELEAKLRQAKEEAERANQAKSEFLANMSHEIRTPLNGVLGMIDLALMSDPKPVIKDYLRLAKQSGGALLSLVNDILDLAKIEAGKAELERRRFGLRQLVEEALSPLKATANQKRLQLACTVAPDAPDQVFGDPGRLRQVLTNLIGNAVKFTAAGQVIVEVSLSKEPPSQASKARVQFRIKDTGIGIPKEKIDVLFEPFSQIGSSAHATYGGTGLGLSISWDLVEMMGGRIWAESEPGQGSVFSFTAEFDLAGEERPQARERAHDEPCPAARPLRILLAEDNAVNRMLATELLTRKGHAVVEAKNGREAITALGRDRFDLVLMDASMPVMDGLEATRLIRQGDAPGVDPDMPIIALTAHALRGDRERFLAAGMNDYLAKPLDFKDLDRALERACRTKS